MNTYPLLDAAEKLIADTRRTSEQSRKLIDSTNEQIMLSHPDDGCLVSVCYLLLGPAH
jgi:hypothetical protein